MKNFVNLICIATPLLLTGCASSTGEDGNGNSDGVFGLGELEGEYDLTAAADEGSALFEVETPECKLFVNGSKVTANCTKTDGVALETLTVDITIQETFITGGLVYTLDDPAYQNNCYSSFKETKRVEGTATKNSDATGESGVFSPLAENWTGSYLKTDTYDLTLVDGASTDCGFEDYSTTFSFDADIMGSSASVAWTAPDYDGETFTVTAGDDSFTFTTDDQTNTVSKTD